MADLELTLSWLGMSQYLDRFVEAGFDSWETMLEVTENDLEILNVDLGSRRKLQREIANTKRLARDPAFVQPLYGLPSQQQQPQWPRSQQPRQPFADGASLEGPTKRGYRHHPKSDKDAPERPYSAYVLFSNHTREDLKAHNLTFTDLSKTVGERWQALSPDEKEPWKQKAAGPWEEYKEKVAGYQKTDKCRAYQKYVAEFKASQENKKPAGKQSGMQLDPASSKVPSQYPSRTAKYPRANPTPGSQETPTKGDSRIAIKRLRREEDSWGEGEKRRPPRIRQACEPCRRKKMKCHGEQPACRQCKDAGTECQYDNGRQYARKEEETNNLWQKVKAYEALLLKTMVYVDNDDQQAIQDAFLMPPQLEGFRERHEARSKFGNISDDDSDRHGEDSAEGVGSMGSTDQVNENNFVKEGRLPQQTTAFAGQASDNRWLQKLERELSGDLEPASPDITKPRLQAEDKDMSLVGGQLYPFELPLRETADALVNTYFNSVHRSFPILDKQRFLTQYREIYNVTDTASFKDHTFIAMAHLVFAIGAVHAHLVDAEWAGDSRDHMLYFANARVLAVDSGVLNDACYLGQVQVFGLGSIYLLVTDQINRSWNLIALAIRSAQSVGLHLNNVTRGIKASTKLHLANVWFAAKSLEAMLTIMTGRPSMISERFCTVSFERIRADEDESSVITTPSEESYQISTKGRRTRTSSSATCSNAYARGARQQSTSSTAELYFGYYVELCSLAKEVVGELYQPAVRKKKWAEIQSIIETFDKRIVRWRDGLNPPFDVASQSADVEIESCRVALRILFHSTRTIINRPCLCNLNQRIADQSRSSKRTNQGAASKCVESARMVLDLILHKPDSTVLHQGATWWLIMHHLKRALIVILLELSFRAEHMPADAAELLVEAKAAVNWLRRLADSSPSAKQTWVTLSRLLQQAAQKVGGDATDMIPAPMTPAAEPPFSMDFGSGAGGFNVLGLGQPSGAYDPNDPNIFPPLRLYDGFPQTGGTYFGDVAATHEWEEFGFLRADGGMGGMVGGQQQDVSMDQQQHPSSQQWQQGFGQGPAVGGGGGGSGGGQRQQMSPTEYEQSLWMGFSDIGAGASVDHTRRRL